MNCRRIAGVLIVGLFTWGLTPLAAQQGSAQQPLPSGTAPSQAGDHATSASNRIEPVDVFADGGILVLKTADDRFRWWLDGRVMWDGAIYAGSHNQLASGGELRRGRLGFRMVFWKDWAAKFEVDFADSEAEVTDMWLAYVGFTNAMVKVGHYTEPFGFESLLSSRYSTFTERALVHEFSPERHLGISYSRWGRRWQATAGLFGQTVGEKDVTGESQGYGVMGRVTATPVRTRSRVMHLGLAGGYRTPRAAVDRTLADADTVRFRARPETHVNRGYFIDTGQIEDVDHTRLAGLEWAAAFGPVAFQAERVAVSVSRTAGARQVALPTPRFSAWYVSGSWFLTGEQRPYESSTGLFGRVMPRHPRGAVELAARYSRMDLNDEAAGIRGGAERVATVGVNWYANPNVRLMLDLLNVSTDRWAVGDRHYRPLDTFSVVQARLQLHF